MTLTSRATTGSEPRKLRRLVAAAAVASLTAVAAAGAQPETTLIDFSFEDQFGRTYTHESWPGRGLIVVAGDRKGSQFTSRWSGALRTGLEERGRGDAYRIVGLSHLDSVPRLLRRMILKKFPQDEESWVLLDWNGRFADAYGFEKDSCNVWAFSAEGELLVSRAATELDPEALEEMLAILVAD